MTGATSILIGRRAFVGSAAMLTGIPTATWIGQSARPLMISDHRFETARTWALAAERQGHKVHRIAGDVTTLWRQVLRAHWATASGPITGLTTPRTLFCLERLAWDQGHRVVARAAMHEGSLPEGETSLVRWMIDQRG